MNNDTLVTSIIKSTRRVRDQYDAAISRAAHQCGITRPEADVLLFLYNNPTLNTARDIVYYRGFSKAYVSKAVDPLIRQGMINMTTDPSDRRRQLLSISGGAEIAEKLRTAQAAFLSALTEGIPQSELDCFMAVNEAMYKNAERIGE